MKKQTLVIILLAILLVASLVFAACTGPEGPIGPQGEQGIQGPQGNPGSNGTNGITPQLKIGEDNYWYVSYDNGTTWANLGVKATGADGSQGPQGEVGPQGPSGITPQLKIGEDNYWYVSYDNGTTWANLGVKATGADGSQGPQGEVGPQGPSGITPQLKIGEDNYWYVSYDNGTTWANLGVKATGADGSQGPQGEQGEVGPQGPQGEQGEVGPQGPQGEQGEQGVSIVGTAFDENGNMVITYSDGTTQIVEHSWQLLYTLEPACIGGGKDIYSCVDCGLLRVVIGSQMEHNYSGDNCRACGAEVPYSKGLTYTLLPDGTYSVARGDCQDAHVVIPSINNGKPVTSIVDFAFSYYSNLTSISIPEGVTSIGLGAFVFCTSLTSVTIPSTVTNLTPGAFALCSSLTNIEVDANNPNYKSVDGNVYSKDGKTLVHYAVGKTDTTFVIPSDVTSIADWTFYGCTGLTSITIPSGVTSIGSSAFLNCSGLTSITIPSSVTSIGSSAFQNCSGLTSITIPSSVTSIGDSAFSNCRGLTSITISSSVTSIGSSAFYNCSSLTSITIPDSVTSIGEDAFNNCSSLAIVYYAGTEEQWNNISIDADNEYLTNANIEFAHSHNYTSAVITEPTCTEQGYTTYACPCGSSYADTYVDALGHDEFACQAQDPTCEEPGWGDGVKCSRCDYTTCSSIPALGHDYISHEAQEVTCLEIGWEAYATCSRCDYTTYQEIPALGHQIPVLTQIYTTTNDSNYPFDVSDGIIISTNKSHSSSSTYTITALYAFELELQYRVSSENSYDYLAINHNFTQKVKASGTSNLSYTTITISMQPGDTVTITYSKDSSQSNGEDCAYVIIVTPVNEVVLGDATEENIESLSCTEDVICALCSTVLAEKSDHDLSSYSAQSPTCDTIGWYAYEACSRCDYSTYQEIPATGHTYSSVVTAPSCSTQGYTTHTCHCGDSYVDTYVAANGVHNFQEADTCAYCGQNIADVAVDSYNMSKTADDNVRGYVVPRMDGNYDAYIKGAGAMKNYSSSPFDVDGYTLKNAYIQDGVTSIGSSAFQNCRGLTSITIPNGVTSIGSDAFYYCSSLTSVTIGNSVTSIGSDAFYYCSSLTSVTIGNSVTSIGSYAFYSCYSLTSITIGNSVTSIGYWAFYNCYSLTSITIPDSVTSIGYYAFYSCNSLTSITIPDSVTSIGENAFYDTAYYNDTNNWDNKVLYIGNCLIAAKTTIETCTIKAGTTVIADDAFYGCSSLTTVYYPGTQAQWNSIEIGSDNSYLTDANIVFNYTGDQGGETPTHECANVCPICGKCTNENCAESACAEKCEGHNAGSDEPTQSITTIAGALAAEEGVAVELTGTVTGYYNGYKSNFYIEDETGNSILVYYATADANIGDIVKVVGTLGSYNGTKQVAKGATFTVLTAHSCDYSEATCLNAPMCAVCGETSGEALGHTDEADSDGKCDRCGVSLTVSESGLLATFQFGANGSAAHVDGNAMGTSKSYTDGAYQLALTGMSKAFGPATDAKGNSCIKLGTSTVTGALSFTVGEDVTQVIIYVAKYKSNTTKINVNGVDYTLTKNSNDGEYDAIVVDTSITKTVEFKTISGGVRCMIDKIEYYSAVAE